MREILFKAKRKDNGEWAEGCLIIDYVSGQYFIHQNGNSVNESPKIGEEGCLRFLTFEIDSDTICQYTGLTDKNGKKIWENDILELPGEDDYFTCEWVEDTARFVMNGDGLTVDFDNYWDYQTEVAGNTFDNAELLEVK